MYILISSDLRPINFRYQKKKNLRKNITENKLMQITPTESC